MNFNHGNSQQISNNYDEDDFEFNHQEGSQFLDMPKNKKQKVDMVKFNKEFKNMSVKDKTSYFVSTLNPYIKFI